MPLDQSAQNPTEPKISNWQKIFASFENNSCPNECREKCSANKWSYAHATEW